MRKPPRLVPKYSLPRRLARIAVWSILVTVAVMRFLMPSVDRIGPPGFAQFRGPQGGDMFRGGRTRRALRIQPATSPVPADLFRIEIELGRREENALRGYHWNGWGGGGRRSERPEVSVTVREGGVTYTNVSLHLKGSAGSFQPYDSKPGLTLNFSKHVKGRTFHGFTKISLNNSVQDPSLVSDQLCRELFVQAGVPAPGADHATVLLNGRDLGVYVLSEGWAKTFLKRHFKDPDGTLYESGFVQDINGEIEIKSGADENTDPVRRLARAASANNPTNRWQLLSATLDVDRFVRFMAMEVLVVHWDGYCLNRNNYRIYHDPSSDRLVFLPHGMDQMFGAGRGSPDHPIDSPMQALVARAVMSTREGRKLYYERISEFRTNLLQEALLTNRVAEISRRIRPTLAAYGPEFVRDHDMHVRDLTERILDRCRSLSQQLVSPPAEIEFDAQGIARMSGWRPRTVNQGGEIRYDRLDADGDPRLRISARRGGGTGSWRASTTLQPGRYRFEGRAMTKGTTQGGGVGLRISGARVPMRRVEEGEWVPLGFEFEVDGPASGVELVAEFSAGQGEVVFDQASLQLKRLE